jgi:2-polyprenyl-3-methyl-5-hydroxy-6-metoxy-1,4-benzoquinol methylase
MINKVRTDGMENDNSGAVCLCGNSALVRNGLVLKSGRDLLQCVNCGLYQLHPYPVSWNEDIEIYSEPQYLGKIESDEYFGYFMALYNSTLVNLVKSSSSILDFGSGHSYYHKFLKQLGFGDVTSLEVNPHLVHFAKNVLNIDNVVSDLSELKGRRFDLIIANQVFEHLFDPVKLACGEIFNLLRDGGYLVFTVPNAASLNRVVLGRRWIGYTDEHIWFFDRSSASKLFSNSGQYSVQECKVKSAVNTCHDRFRPRSVIKRIYYKTFMRIFETIGRGDQLIVVLRK